MNNEDKEELKTFVTALSGIGCFAIVLYGAFLGMLFGGFYLLIKALQ